MPFGSWQHVHGHSRRRSSLQPAYCLSFWLAATIATAAAAARAEPPPVFLNQWGSFGRGPGQFLDPRGIGVGPDGSVYVVDIEARRVQRFNANGGLISTLTSPVFVSPTDVAIDAEGNVYVTDLDAIKVFKFDPGGTLIRSWDAGNGAGPRFVAVDANGDVYVTANSFTFIYDQDGTYLLYIGRNGRSGDGAFDQAWGVTVDPDRNVYIVDNGNAQVQKFNALGAFLLRWGTAGARDSEFSAPFGVAVTSTGRIVVSDQSRIQVFSSAGAFLSTSGRGDGVGGEFSEPIDVATDAMGNIYVVDALRYRVRRYADIATSTRSMSWGHIKALYR